MTLVNGRVLGSLRMLGLMQDWPLTLDKILDHAKRLNPRREIVTRTVEGPIERTNYAALYDRSKQVSAALIELGVGLGTRVGTLAWNTARHMETWYGAMGIGAVVHTLNPRLLPEQIAWIANHGGDEVLCFDATFIPLVEQIAPLLTSVKHFVLFADKVPQTKIPNLRAYEELIANRPLTAPWGGFDENTAAGLCYTSGTTGNPKGVLYSHRSNMLTALVVNQGDGLSISTRDVVLPIVPMFHANAWALTFVAPMAGAKFVLPGPKLDGPSVYELLETEGVTFTGAVPTVWLALLTFLRENKLKLSTLKRVIIGGSALPESILRAFEEDYGVSVVQGWGMTETSPIGTLGTLGAEQLKLSHDEQMKIKLKQGRTPFSMHIEIFDDEGHVVPHDGHKFGKLKIKGPNVARGYYRGDGALTANGEALDENGFFDTGDVATIDPDGYMQITDRAKDVIKSGGEWISSIDIENIAVGAPGVANAAVIGLAHPKWDERPLLIIEPKPGAAPTKEELLRFLEGKIAKWWTPDDVVMIDKIPLGATGKINKLALRETFKDHRLPTIG
jgi:fatty-acyl-CoA synthase